MLPNVIREVNKPGISKEIQDRIVIECGERFCHNMREHSSLCWRYQLVQFFYCVSLFIQFEIIVQEFGNGDYMYAYKLWSHRKIPYGDWPLDLVKSLPKQAICGTRSYGISGEIETRDTICTLGGNATFQLMLALLSGVIVVAIVLNFWSFLSGSLFMLCRSYRLYTVRNTLNVTKRAPAMQVVQDLSQGSCFLILLMEKNMDNDILCNILSKASSEMRLNATEVKRNLNGVM